MKRKTQGREEAGLPRERDVEPEGGGRNASTHHDSVHLGVLDPVATEKQSTGDEHVVLVIDRLA